MLCRWHKPNEQLIHLSNRVVMSPVFLITMQLFCSLQYFSVILKAARRSNSERVEM